MFGNHTSGVERVETLAIVVIIVLALVAIFFAMLVTKTKHRIGVITVAGLLVVAVCVHTGSTVRCVEEADGRPGGCSFFGNNVRTAIGD